jgi:hypothetical protein
MPESTLYAGERNGSRIFRIGRVGYDQDTSDLPDTNAQVYTGTLRTERIAPAGVGSLINFRRVAIHLLVSGTYTFTVKVWISEEQTELGDDTAQTIVISETVAGGLREVTEICEIEGVGSHIQIELTVDSDDITGVFLIERIDSHGRVVRSSANRTGEAE